MSEGVTVTGLKELMAAVDRLPETVTAALKQHAVTTATTIMEEYRRRLLSQTKAVKTADSARLLDESDRKQIVVNVPGDPADPSGVPGWLEYGTSRMAAKPSLRPARDAEADRYKRDMAIVAEQALREALGA